MVQRNSFSQSFRVNLLVINFLSFPSSENVLNYSSFPKCIFARYWILGWHPDLSSIWKCFATFSDLHEFWWEILYHSNCFSSVRCRFSFYTLKIFSPFHLVFRCLTMMFLDVAFYSIILFGIDFSSWILMFVFCQTWTFFHHYFLSIFSSLLFFPLRTLLT